MEATQIKAANLLLNRGIRFTIPDAPFFDRLFRQNRIHIRPLYGGTIMEIAILMLENELDEKMCNKELHSKLEVIAKAIATAVLNDERQIELKRDKLTKKLLWKVPAHVLIKIYRYIEGLNEIKDFMNITNFFNRQSRMMMAKRTGQKKQGS